jgi:hypothetical protein
MSGAVARSSRRSIGTCPRLLEIRTRNGEMSVKQSLTGGAYIGTAGQGHIYLQRRPFDRSNSRRSSLCRRQLIRWRDRAFGCPRESRVAMTSVLVVFAHRDRLGCHSGGLMSAQWLTPSIACHWAGSSHPGQPFARRLAAHRPRMASPSAHKAWFGHPSGRSAWVQWVPRGFR